MDWPVSGGGTWSHAPGPGRCAGALLAGPIVSAQALMRAGFRAIDAPVRTRLHADFTMCNVGVVLRPSDAHAYAVGRYFDECERHVLGSHTIAERFTVAEPDVLGAA